MAVVALTIAASVVAAVASVVMYVLLAQLGGVLDALRVAAVATAGLLPLAALIAFVVAAGVALVWPRKAALPSCLVLAGAGGGTFGFLVADGSPHVSPWLAATSGALAWLSVSIATLALLKASKRVAWPSS